MVSAEWVLSLMLKVQSTHPKRETYEKTSVAIAQAASRDPLFSGQHGEEKTASLIVALGYFESGLMPDAEGDCVKDGKGIASVGGRCPTGAKPQSFCFLQIHGTNFEGLGVTRAEVQSDIDVCIRIGLRLMHQSFLVCRSLPVEDRLRQYAGGGPVCPTNDDAMKKSRHRWAKGQWLFKALPPA